MVDPDRLKALDEKLRAKQVERKKASRTGSKSDYSGADLAWRMVIELVVGMLIGFGIGYGLDRLFGTLPIFLVLFSLLGFAAGVRTMMRTAEEARQKQAKARQEQEG